MKILFFVRRFYPLVGGVEKHVFEVSQQLLVKGHKVIVVTEKDDKQLSHETLKNGIEICRLHVGNENRNKKFRIWKEIWKLKEVIRQADVIHCHDVFFWYLPLRFFYLQKPVYTTFHGYEGYPISQKAILLRKISERLSWGNICIGDFIKKWYGTKPTYVSYGGAKIIQQEIKNYKKESAVFVGRLVKENSITIYSKAMELLLKENPRFKFAVIGDGPYYKKLNKHITVVGFKKNPEDYYPRFHFAFVSSYLSILEAFASKRLVFAVYDNPLKEDYLKMTPFRDFIVLADSAEDLSKKVLYFLKHPEQEKHNTERAFNWVNKQQWENITQLYLKLWKQ